MRRFWFVGAVLWLAMLPGFAHAADAASTIKDVADRAVTILSTQTPNTPARGKQLEALFKSSLDLDFLGRFAAGRYWRQMSAQEQQEYQSAFESYVLRLYAGQLNGYSGETFMVTGSRKIDDNDTLVSSQLSRTNRAPVDIDWRVRTSGNSNKIVDVSIEGVSMALNQRQEFSSILQRDGIDGLIRRLRQPYNTGPPR